MELLSATVTPGFIARLRPESTTFPSVGRRLTSAATIGDATAITYAAADIAYAVSVLADDNDDVADIALASGARTQTTGTPAFDPPQAIDFSGVALPAMDKCYALRITTASGNAGSVIVEVDLRSLALTLNAGESFLLALDASGSEVAEGGVTFTFSTGGDSVIMEILASATPS
jgi:hypothetical protein